MNNQFWSQKEDILWPAESSVKQSGQRFRVNLRLRNRNEQFEKYRVSLGLVPLIDQTASELSLWQSVVSALNIRCNNKRGGAKGIGPFGHDRFDSETYPIELFREWVIDDLTHLSFDLKKVVGFIKADENGGLLFQARLQESIFCFIEIISVMSQVNKIDPQLFARQITTRVFEIAYIILDHINRPSFELVN